MAGREVTKSGHVTNAMRRTTSKFCYQQSASHLDSQCKFKRAPIQYIYVRTRTLLQCERSPSYNRINVRTVNDHGRLQVMSCIRCA